MVPRRRDSLAKLDKRLKDLAKQLPKSDVLFDSLFGLVESTPRPEAMDRTAAVAAAQYVENALQVAIKAHLKKEISEAESKELFDGLGAPLGSFSSRIVMASALGITSREETEDLDTIRNIRNAFAHSAIHMTFESEEVKGLCLALHALKDFGIEGLEDVIGAKWIYITAIGQLYFKLVTHFPGSPWSLILEPPPPPGAPSPSPRK